MSKMTPEDIIRIHGELKARRGLWEQQWQEIYDYIIPRRSPVIRERAHGDEDSSPLVFDNTAMVANELLAGALQGLLTSPNTQWFELTTGDAALDDEDEIRFWLKDTARRILNILNNSNFQTEIHELYLDLPSIGTAAMDMEEDEVNIIRFKTRNIKEIFIRENHLGVVDEVYREYKMKSRNIVAQFVPPGVSPTEKLVGRRVIADLKRNGEKEHTIIHAVYPRDLPNPSQLNKPYVSQYILVEDKLELRHSGFNSFPWVVPRWSKASGEEYGRSPAMNAMPEIRLINEQERTQIEAAQKAIDPPIQVPDDGTVISPDLTPGGLTFVRPGSDIRPIFDNVRVDFGFQLLQDRRRRIREAFFVDQLQLGSGPQMTATEVLQRTEEKMRLLGPLLGRQQSELLRPLIDRVFDIMLRRGKLRPVPNLLRRPGGFKIDVQYSSMIARSQRMTEAQSIFRALEAASTFIQLDPSSSHNLDSDKAIRTIWSLFNAPSEILRAQSEVKELKRRQAEAQAQLQQQAQQIQQADIISKVGPTLIQANG